MLFENEALTSAIVFATILIPIATALVEGVKRTAKDFPKEALPGLSLVISVIVGALAYPFTDLDLTIRLWAGVFAGLAGSGLFDLFKGTIKTAKSNA